MEAAEPAPATKPGPEASLTPEKSIDFPDYNSSLDRLFNRGPESRLAPPPPPRIAPSRRSRQLKDRQENWAFMTPEDVVKDYLSSELGVPDLTPDGLDRSSMSVVERYYDRQMRGRTSGASSSRTPSVLDFSGKGFNSSPKSALDAAGALESLQGSPSARPEELSELLGLRNNPFSAQAIREREANQRQMEAFRRALDVQPGPNAVTPLVNPYLAGSQPAPVPAPVATLPPPLSPADIMASTYNPSVMVTPPSLPQLPTAATTPGLTRSQAPDLGTATRPPPPRADFSIPQRQF